MMEARDQLIYIQPRSASAIFDKLAPHHHDLFDAPFALRSSAP